MAELEFEQFGRTRAPQATKGTGSCGVTQKAHLGCGQRAWLAAELCRHPKPVSALPRSQGSLELSGHSLVQKVPEGPSHRVGADLGVWSPTINEMAPLFPPVPWWCFAHRHPNRKVPPLRDGLGSGPRKPGQAPAAVSVDTCARGPPDCPPRSGCPCPLPLKPALGLFCIHAGMVACVVTEGGHAMGDDWVLTLSLVPDSGPDDTSAVARGALPALAGGGPRGQAAVREPGRAACLPVPGSTLEAAREVLLPEEEGRRGWGRCPAQVPLTGSPGSRGQPRPRSRGGSWTLASGSRGCWARECAQPELGLGPSRG